MLKIDLPSNYNTYYRTVLVLEKIKLSLYLYQLRAQEIADAVLTKKRTKWQQNVNHKQ